jgi:hypothetical protein
VKSVFEKETEKEKIFYQGVGEVKGLDKCINNYIPTY